MAKYEVKFDATNKPIRVRNLRAAAKLAQGRAFIARKCIGKKYRGPWAKYVCTGKMVRCVRRQDR